MTSNNTNNTTSGFEDFCGGTFWHIDEVWYNPNGPEFSPCFQVTALVWGPCGFLWLLFIPYIHYLYKLESQHLGATTRSRLKTLFGTLLFLTSLVDTIKGGIDNHNGERPVAYVVTPAILSFTLLVTVILIRVERIKALVTSGVLFLFHLLLVITGIVPFYMKILEPNKQGWHHDKFRFITFYVYYFCLLVQFLLFCFAENIPVQSPFPGKKPCPEVQSSFLSRLTFWWINGLVFQGYKKPLEEDDLWALNPRDLTQNLHPHFEKVWRAELAQTQCGLKQAGLKRQMSQKYGRQVSRRSHSEASETTPLLLGRSPSLEKGDCEVTVKVPKKKSASLLKTLTKVYGLTLFRSNLCKLVCDILTFVGPILQSALIDYTSSDMPPWKGYLFASLFFVQAVVYSFFFHQVFHIGMTLGMNIKAALIAAVYKKAITMSNEARKTSTVGEIVNLMSVDAQRMQDVTAYLYLVWSAPLQIVIAMYMLWGILGPSVLAGVGVMILLVPINGVVANIQRKLQLAQMTQKDQRIKLMNEILNGIKVLKLYAWELSFKEKINAIRNLELETLKKNAYLAAFGTFTWTCAPFLVTLATFVTYVQTGNNLDAQKAFVSLSLFTILSFPINVLPMMLAYLVTASVSIKRLGKFLQNPDIDIENVQHNHMAASPLTIEGGTFAWGTGKDDVPILKNINLQVPDGQLVAVVGQVGCGKSSLISAFLGEMEKLSGHVNVRGSVAYVAQQAWIQNQTLRDNILFGKEYSSATYEELLEACALKPDLEILPAGDQTEIGEKGINLSGGQKQRVSLARAVYNDADIYFLDDPLSAVDSHVGKHIFEKVVGPKGLLSGKTRLLVTHGVQWLPRVDTIVVLVNGEISEVGSYEELLSHEGPFAQFLKTYLTQEESESEGEEDEEVKIEKRKILERVASIISDDQVQKKSPSKDSDGGSETRKRSRKISSMQSGDEPKKNKLQRQKTLIEEAAKKLEKDKLIEDEKREEGRVKLSVFLKYFRALGIPFVLLWLVFYIGFQSASVMSNVWLSWWSADPTLNNDSLVNTSDFANTRDMYLGVYGGLGGAQALCVLLYAMICANSMVRASQQLHESMLHNILRAPMSFFDTTPIGRIINRFSRDIETIDNILPNLIMRWMGTFFGVMSILVVISYSTPIFLSVIIPVGILYYFVQFFGVVSILVVISYSTPIFLSVMLPVGILYYFVQRFYIPTSRQLKRIESTTRSPIYVHFSETVTGASTIRAYDEAQRFIATSESKVDHNLTFYFAGIASNRWLGFRLEFVGALIVFSAAMFAVIGKGNGIEPGVVGLSITYALQVTQSLNWLVRMTSDLETNVVSVERIQEYTETEQEAEWYIDRTKPHDSWPEAGKVVLKDYATRYRSGLDLVLRGVNVDVKPGEKVGIVGRTGAGKSSLTLSLFRLIEAAEGRILIDGIPLDTLGLHQLRAKITILPQDPVLFSGTLRMNLDPFDKYTDAQIWVALEHAHLQQFVTGLAAGLDYECGEGGQNLSVGQRQLVCLARTLLRKTKILVLDEATAAVDLETDDLIQNTIRQEFKDCTILTIAHRLNTIMDNDRILVLDTGRVAEYDSPTNLLQNHDSIFYGMAKNAGLV